VEQLREEAKKLREEAALQRPAMSGSASGTVLLKGELQVDAAQLKGARHVAL
jgi:hypothetical protein